MRSPFGGMYLRPGNLWKPFAVKELRTEFLEGRMREWYADAGETFLGILADADSRASERIKHRWDQSQHSLTHTLVMRGRPPVKKGDMLVCGERGFLVLLTDDVGALGVSGIVYLEERNDVK